ncbi:haloacid dehalogenase type II [Actinocrinis sp.]|uniref:haloacid dehalogenase type II n=1 Tax=Actinocrinis sp. TaxID=1920516 RepID=UPI002C5DB7AE|nr:haloacid dehalogenase type II [Actinocrinis sp.]HXR73890.1 haloacid dehalogenase type II [Actinocrinis sp.]
MLFVFDVNETLLDLAALDQPFAELTGTPAARGEWFDLLIHTALTFTAADGYQDFAHLAGECLATVAQAHGRVASDEQRRAILSALRSLPAHPDVPGGLGRLRDAGHRLVALTNSPLATARAQLEHAGIADRFERVFSAEAANALKPAPAAYRLVIDALGIEPADAVMVAAHDWDIAGAQAAGLRTAFLARPGHRPLPATPAPTWTAPDLGALATAVRTT